MAGRSTFRHNFVLHGEDRASGAFRAFGKTTDNLRRKMADFTAIAAHSIQIARALGGAFSSLTAPVKKAIALSAVQERAEAKLGATLRSTKGAVGLTRQELVGLAQGLQAVTEFGDEAIIEAEALALTFTKIGGEVFPQTIETALNMSTVLGQDLRSSVIQLGKALNDPITGATALRRVGVSLTTGQQDLIRQLVASNDLLGAQRVILDELAVEFGGAARAMSKTYGGAVQQLSNSWGDLLERLGQFVTENRVVLTFIKAIRDQVEDWSEGLERLWNTQEGQARAQEIMANGVNALVDVVGVLIRAFGGFAKAMATVIGWMDKLPGVTIALTKEQEILGKKMDEVRGRIQRLNDVLAGAEGGFEEYRGAADDARRTLARLEKNLEILKVAYDQQTSALQEMVDRGVTAATDALAGLKIKARDAAEETGRFSGALEELARPNLERAAGETIYWSNQVEKLNDRIRNLLIGLHDFPAATAAWEKQLEKLNARLDALPIKEQRDELRTFADALAGQVRSAAETPLLELEESLPERMAALSEVSGMAGAEFLASFAGAAQALADELADVAEEVSASGERIGDALGQGISNGLFEHSTAWNEQFTAFGESTKQTLFDAFLTPILGAGSAFQDLFEVAVQPFQAFGKAVNDVVFKPLISGLLGFFNIRTASEKAAAAQTLATQAGVAAGVAAAQAAAVGSLMPGLATAASAALVSTFGGAAAAAGLLPGILSAGAAQGKAAAATFAAIPGAETGMEVTRERLVRVGERGKREVIVPEEDRVHAVPLLQRMFGREPALFAEVAKRFGGGGGGQVAIHLGGISVTSLGDGDDLVDHLLDRIDERLGEAASTLLR